MAIVPLRASEEQSGLVLGGIADSGGAGSQELPYPGFLAARGPDDSRRLASLVWPIIR